MVGLGYLRAERMGYPGRVDMPAKPGTDAVPPTRPAP
jgi:hypothetical protein